MTTREVDGLAVIAEDDATTTMRNRHTGKTVRLRQVRELLLEDGSIAYGCAHCNYSSRNLNSIRPHLKVHKNPSPAPTPAAAVDTRARTLPRVPKGAVTSPPAKPAVRVAADPVEFPGVAEFVRAMTEGRGGAAWDAERRKLVEYHEARHAAVVAQRDKMAVDRDQWRQRAKSAERLLTRLNDALVAAGGA